MLNLTLLNQLITSLPSSLNLLDQQTNLSIFQNETISLVEYDRFVSQVKNSSTSNTTNSTHVPSSTWYCSHCKKKFTSTSTFEDHQRSKKHLQAIAKSNKLTLAASESTLLSSSSDSLQELQNKVNQALNISLKQPEQAVTLLWDAAQAFWHQFHCPKHSAETLLHLLSLFLTNPLLNITHVPLPLARWQPRLLFLLARFIYLFQLSESWDEALVKDVQLLSEFQFEELLELVDRLPVHLALKVFQRALELVPFENQEAIIWNQLQSWVSQKRYTHIIQLAIQNPVSKWILLEGFLAGFLLNDFQGIRKLLVHTSSYPDELEWEIFHFYFNAQRCPTQNQLQSHHFFRQSLNLSTSSTLVQEACELKLWQSKDVQRYTSILKQLI